VLRQDASGVWWFEALATPERQAELDRRLTTLTQRLNGPPGSGRPWRLGPLAAAPGAAARHLAAVEECVERIAAGELFQANLCLRLEAGFEGSAADAFVAAAERLRPAHGAFLDLPRGAVLSFSPELFLRRRGDRLLTSPIKGTAVRSGRRDDAERSALLASAKDAAEHVMIVDLARNDLGRVAEYGSVAAGEPRLEAHPGVWHLVSDVIGDARAGVTDASVLRAAFPPGSVTGAPKIQALKVIADLEGTQREVYTGAIGYASPIAGMELNVAIRTLELRGERGWLGCGGGIVADSEPRGELAEALAKAEPIARALGAGLAPAPAPRRPPHALPPFPRRPDPAAGVLETIAVRDGHAVEIAAHLARLAASALEIYDVVLPDDLAEAVAENARGASTGRLRVLLRPGAAPVVELAPFGPGPAPVGLHPRSLAGGLGAHKWLDRPGRPTDLVVDLDGTVLETGSANLWLLREGTLVTPPADGRLLPGVTRARLLASEAFATTEEHMTLEDLENADGLVLTSSVSLATPAALAPFEPTAGAVELAAALREHPAISRRTRSYIR
jgi:para-aminobenzoate synthetase/4-amino-4-deoxychorismate lyase